MALSEQEEFELLSLERERALSAPKVTPAPKPQSPGLGERMLGGAVRGMPAGPIGMLFGATSPITEDAQKKYEESAYKAGGAVTDIAAQRGLPPEVAAGAGFAANVGIQGLPVVAGSVAGKAAEYPRRLGRWLMQSAIKPSAAMRRSGEAEKAIETMLQKGISPTSKGLEATKGAIDDLEVSIQSVLENSEGRANKAAIGDKIKVAFDDVKYNLNRAANEKDIDTALANFFKHPEIKRYEVQFPVAIANRMKQAFYKEIGERGYIPGAEASAYDKGQKALAAGLREEVLRAEPKVRPNLEEQAKMMRVAEMLKERVGAAENQNVVGLGGAMSPSITRMMIYWADRYPWFKGWLARSVYTGAYPMTAGAGAGAGIVAGEEITESLEKRSKK